MENTKNTQRSISSRTNGNLVPGTRHKIRTTSRRLKADVPLSTLPRKSADKPTHNKHSAAGQAPGCRLHYFLVDILKKTHPTTHSATHSYVAGHPRYGPNLRSARRQSQIHGANARATTGESGMPDRGDGGVP